MFEEVVHNFGKSDSDIIQWNFFSLGEYVVSCPIRSKNLRRYLNWQQLPDTFSDRKRRRRQATSRAEPLGSFSLMDASILSLCYLPHYLRVEFLGFHFRLYKWFFFSFGCKCTCAKDTMTLSLDLLELLKHQSLKINPVANGRPIRKQNF